jgi:hypothetical protein
MEKPVLSLLHELKTPKCAGYTAVKVLNWGYFNDFALQMGCCLSTYLILREKNAMKCFGFTA